MKYPYKTQLETVAWLILAHVPMEQLPDQILELYRETGAGDSNGCLDCIHDYLKEAAAESVDSEGLQTLVRQLMESAKQRNRFGQIGRGMFDI